MSLLATMAGSRQDSDSDRRVDLIIRGARVVTLAQPPEAQAVAIRGDKIVAIGSNAQADKWVTDGTTVLDAKGGLVIPGFIDSHAHMMSLGASKSQLELIGTRSVDEIALAVARVATSRPAGRWIQGRGWDQNDWATRQFPTSASLSRVAADHPVALFRVDGHAVWVNQKAMELAQVLELTEAPAGGEIVRDADGHPTGVFVDTAMDLITRVIPVPTAAELHEHLQIATEECLRNGVTSLHDAGESLSAIQVFKEAAENGLLGVRLYVMGSADNATMTELLKSPPLIGFGNNFLTVRALKVYADGALGSRGAALLEDYSDRTGHRGLTITTRPQIEQIMTRAIGSNFQVCVHAIGDRANRDVLDAFEKVLSNRGGTPGAPYRFRIEHAQILDANDIPRFAKLGMIASMQGCHCTSDMPWVADRLGKERTEEGAYVWQKLLTSGALVANGTDAPVENLSPIECFYATVTRQDKSGNPPDGFYPDQRLSREEALRSYTLSGAFAAFEEGIKGSIELGKLADLVLLDKDIMTVSPAEILGARVVYTIVGGKIVYRNPARARADAIKIAKPSGSTPNPEAVTATWPAKDEAILKGFARLAREKQDDILKRIAARITAADIPLQHLVREILELEPAVRSTIGVDQPYPIHAPEEFAPALPIKRVAAKHGDALYKKVHDQFAKKLRPLLTSRYRYDFAQNAIFASTITPDAMLRNYLLGYPPDADLAQAILIKRWDQDATFDALAAFFHHAYCALNGELFADISLFDVWDAGKKVDVPDVDAIAFARQILHDDSYVSPIPADKRREQLYETISKYFARYRNYRYLREAAAALFLEKKPSVAAGYDLVAQRCHFLFATQEERVDGFAGVLKSTKDRDDFIRLADKLQQGNWTRTNQLLEERFEWLDRSHGAIRELALQVLKESSP